MILFIAYVIVGPEDMGKLARTLAKALREFRKLSADLREEVKVETDIPEIFPDQKTAVGHSDPAAAEMESVLKEIQKAEDMISRGSGKSV